MFKSQDDRKKAAAQIKGEGNKVADLFLGLHSLSKPAVSLAHSEMYHKPLIQVVLHVLPLRGISIQF